MIGRALLLGMLAAVMPTARPATADPASWDALLTDHARGGGLDYAALAADGERLDAYSSWLSDVSPQGWSDSRRLAFWINAYNASVARLVLERYPEITSVRDVDGFFDTLEVPVAGSLRTLDEIENEAREIGDPRAHFAVVCASTSCPDLRAEAYTVESLDDQLEDQTRRFLADPSKGLRFDEEAGVLHLSSIFKWYAGDFTGGSTVVAFFARGGVTEWVADHVAEDLATRIRRAEPSVRYMDYDWSLNDRPGSRSSLLQDPGGPRAPGALRAAAATRPSRVRQQAVQ
jgi:hypothetical protein